MARIDLHAHAIVPESQAALAAAHPDRAPRLVERADGFVMEIPGRPPMGPMPRGMVDPVERIAAMDRQGIDVQVLAVPPPGFGYEVTGQAGVDFASVQNDGLVAMAAAHAGRFAVLGTLPLQQPEAAAAEVERIAAMPTVRGVEIGTNVNGALLDDRTLDPVWSALESAGLPVWVHPDQRTIAGADRLSRYYLQNLIGNPLETTIAIAALVFGGVLERHPGLRFGFVHGGGFVPYQLARWDHGWRVRTEPRSVTDSTPPSEYVGRMFFDSLTHDVLALELLGRRFGWDHVVIGTDYPFDMGEDDPVAKLCSLGLSAEQLDGVLGGNAETFLRAG